jgi:hypothetical protein
MRPSPHQHHMRPSPHHDHMRPSPHHRHMTPSPHHHHMRHDLLRWIHNHQHLVGHDGGLKMWQFSRGICNCVAAHNAQLCGFEASAPVQLQGICTSVASRNLHQCSCKESAPVQLQSICTCVASEIATWEALRPPSAASEKLYLCSFRDCELRSPSSSLNGARPPTQA